jgi:hypothetical protein
LYSEIDVFYSTSNYSTSNKPISYVGSNEVGDVSIDITNDLKSGESHYGEEIDINRQSETEYKQHVGIDNQNTKWTRSRIINASAL